MSFYSSKLFAAAFLLSAPLCHAQQASALPLWEVGLGAAGLSMPAYPGASERSSRLLPFPYLIYRGEILRAGQEGINARLFNTDRVQFDIGLAGSLPADADDVPERAGMPDLGAMFEFGPRLKLKLAQPSAMSAVRFELPLRAVFEARSGVHRRGWSIEPKLAYEVRDARANWTLEANLSALWADTRLQSHFYEVAPQYVLPWRERYSAGSGLLLTRLGLFGTRRLHEDVRLFGYVRLESYAGAENRASPLHRRDTGLAGGVGVIWTFARASRMASARASRVD